MIEVEVLFFVVPWLSEQGSVQWLLQGKIENQAPIPLGVSALGNVLEANKPLIDV